ncbi:MAG: killer suppression protein HigA [Paludibacter sp.]|nr:killer suppression protein HigA [Paludibacter sp.]
MEITFDDKKLEKLANDYKKCQKQMGLQRAKLYNKRLGDLANAVTLEDVRNLPGRYHELTKNRKGQWACDLDQPYRLIFEPHEHPIPADSTGKYLWIEIKGVEIIEITDYHE